ncbi:MAG TPA: hypothetical protein VEF33_02490 [Syntrophales bacterium]|nr:hypothetical protein [Syntrophales bacterium]
MGVEQDSEMDSSLHSGLPLVWYASYASNLSKKRFLCYIRGGVPRWCNRAEPGCRDKTVPRLTKPVLIPRPMYFATKSSAWGSGGVAFLGLSKAQENFTLGRMYLITTEQFIDTVSQENNNIAVSIDFEAVIRSGSAIFHDLGYGNIVYLGEDEGFPIFTFTASRDLGHEPFTAPPDSYIKTIALGLRETYNLDNDQICQYLIEKSGVKGNIAVNTLASLIEDGLK